MANFPTPKLKSIVHDRLIQKATDSNGSLANYQQAVELVKDKLQKVEESILFQAREFDPEVEDYVVYVFENGGKRLRPLLVLLSAGATGTISESHLNLAIILEIIHVASLIHDDIMDGAQIRRGRPTAWAKWGNTTSVLLGDALFSHALRLSTQFDDSEICRRIADTSVDVCSGEIIQNRRRFDTSLTLPEYFKIIEMKTAALFAAACELSAKLNQANPETCQNLRTFGLRLGMAYQAFDDCLDLAGSEPSAGKTLGTDLQKGKFTLPVLLLLQENGNAHHFSTWLSKLEKSSDSVAIETFVEEIRERGFLQQASSVVFDLLTEAETCLESLKANPYTDGLRAIVGYIRKLSAELA